MAERVRKNLITFYVDDEERAAIKLKMQKMNMRNQSLYLRKMALEGRIIQVDYSVFNDIAKQISGVSRNINQIAKRVNATDSIYKEELADKVLQGKYQYVISTHIDRGHIHNHIIFNSVSFQDFGKFHSTASTYRFIKRQSDMLCIENGLSVIEHPENQGKSHYEHLIDKQGRSWKSKLRQVIDYCILKAKDWDEFLILMEREKYEIKYGKYISFRAEGQERFTRSKTLGDNYTEENIRKRIAGAVVRTVPKAPDIRHNLVIDIENNIKAQQSKGYENWAKKFNLKLVAETVNYLTENNILNVEELDSKISALSEQRSSKRSRIKEIDKQIKLLEEQIHDIDSYRKSKRVVDAAPKHFGIEKYRHDHESDYIIYAASVKSLKKHFGGSSLPLIKDLRTEQKKLRAEKDKLIRETSSEKPELDELKTMRRNIDLFLGVDNNIRENTHKIADELN